MLLWWKRQDITIQYYKLFSILSANINLYKTYKFGPAQQNEDACGNANIPP